MKRKRIIASISIVILLLIGCLSLSSCLEKKPKQKTILYLGDSIAEALLGPSPMTERDSFGYYSIVGQINDYRYINRAVSGATIGYFWEALSGTEEYEGVDAFARSYWMEKSDIIVISMLGNDLLGEDMMAWAFETAENYSAGQEKVAEELQKKLDGKCTTLMNRCLDLIYEKNPSVTVIWQTLYNPFYEDSPLISEGDKQTFDSLKEEGKIDENMTFRFVADKMVTALNQVVYKYSEGHENFYVCDVFSAYDEVFQKSEKEGIKLVFADGIHPSTMGHALIADTLQNTLCSLGLASPDDAVAQYKTLVQERTERLFGDSSLDICEVKEKINQAKSIKEVSEIYFTETENQQVAVKSNVTPYENPTLFEEDRTYYIHSIRLEDTELFSIDFASFDLEGMGLGALAPYLQKSFAVMNPYQTYFEFWESGEGIIKITLSDDAIQLLNAANSFKVLQSIDIPEMLDTEFTTALHTTLNMYFTEMFPGFDIADLDKTLDLLESVGVRLEGLERESEDYKKLCDSLREDGTIPSDMVFPKDFGLSVHGYYTMEKITGEKPCTAVYLKLVNTTEDTVPMFCFAITEENDDISQMNFKVEFAHVTIEAILQK